MKTTPLRQQFLEVATLKGYSKRTIATYVSVQFHGQLSSLGQTPAFQALVWEATAKSWNVYAKRPFAGPEQVLKYLSRYTHRVTIGNRRLIRLDRQEQSVAFNYKVRRENSPPIWR